MSRALIHHINTSWQKTVSKAVTGPGQENSVVIQTAFTCQSMWLNALNIKVYTKSTGPEGGGGGGGVPIEVSECILMEGQV